MEVLDSACIYDRAGCDWLLNDLGPPPDSILRIPPPPLPFFLEEELLLEIGLSKEEVENDTLCHLCHWARRLDVVTVNGTTGTGKRSCTSSVKRALEQSKRIFIKSTKRN